MDLRKMVVSLHGAMLGSHRDPYSKRELSEAASQPSASGELGKPNPHSRVWAGGVGARLFCTAAGERWERDSARQRAPAPLVSRQLPGLCRSPSAILWDGTAVAVHRIFHQTAKLPALALSLTVPPSLEVSSKCKGVAPCSWVLKLVWHEPERTQAGGLTQGGDSVM